MAISSLLPDWKRTCESPISGRDANAERLDIEFGRYRAIVETHVTWLAQSVRRLSDGLDRTVLTRCVSVLQITTDINRITAATPHSINWNCEIAIFPLSGWSRIRILSCEGALESAGRSTADSDSETKLCSEHVIRVSHCAIAQPGDIDASQVRSGLGAVSDVIKSRTPSYQLGACRSSRREAGDRIAC
jgi:hypothetical protein